MWRFTLATVAIAASTTAFRVASTSAFISSQPWSRTTTTGDTTPEADFVPYSQYS